MKNIENLKREGNSLKLTRRDVIWYMNKILNIYDEGSDFPSLKIE